MKTDWSCDTHRYRHSVHWITEGSERSTGNCTHLLQRQSLVRKLEKPFRLKSFESTECGGVYSWCVTSAAGKYTTAGQSLCPSSWTWTGSPTTGDVMASRPECEASKLSCIFSSFVTIFLTFVWFLCRYHHTGPVTAFYSLRESLTILAEEVRSIPILDFPYRITHFWKERIFSCNYNYEEEFHCFSIKFFMLIDVDVRGIAH